MLYYDQLTAYSRGLAAMTHTTSHGIGHLLRIDGFLGNVVRVRPCSSQRGNSCGSRVCIWQQPQRRPSCPRASRQDDKSLSKLEVEVPPEQRPVNELRQLKESPLYSWATLDLWEYGKRLVILWGAILVLLAGPIAFQTFDPKYQPLEFILSATAGSLVVVAGATLRIYLGWKYVADRLMTATLEYEETGWYDGQFFVKPPEILTRDRLLGTYEVRPVMARIRQTLQATGMALAAATAALIVSVRGGSDGDNSVLYGHHSEPARITPDGILFSGKVKSLSQLVADDEAAEQEALAQNGVPGYCRWEIYADECQ